MFCGCEQMVTDDRPPNSAQRKSPLSATGHINSFRTDRPLFSSVLALRMDVPEINQPANVISSLDYLHFIVHTYVLHEDRITYTM